VEADWRGIIDGDVQPAGHDVDLVPGLAEIRSNERLDVLGSPPARMHHLAGHRRVAERHDGDVGTPDRSRPVRSSEIEVLRFKSPHVAIMLAPWVAAKTPSHVAMLLCCNPARRL